MTEPQLPRQRRAFASSEILARRHVWRPDSDLDMVVQTIVSGGYARELEVMSELVAPVQARLHDVGITGDVAEHDTYVKLDGGMLMVQDRRAVAGLVRALIRKEPLCIQVSSMTGAVDYTDIALGPVYTWEVRAWDFDGHAFQPLDAAETFDLMWTDSGGIPSPPPPGHHCCDAHPINYEASSA